MAALNEPETQAETVGQLDKVLNSGHSPIFTSEKYHEVMQGLPPTRGSRANRIRSPGFAAAGLINLQPLLNADGSNSTAAIQWLKKDGGGKSKWPGYKNKYEVMTIKGCPAPRFAAVRKPRTEILSHDGTPLAITGP